MWAEGTYLSNSLVIKGPSPWTDVRAHGATGNGRDDDASAIQTAIDSLPTADGGFGADGGPRYGTVFLPPGRYSVGAPIEISHASHLTIDP
jgi:polygalacturonase